MGPEPLQLDSSNTSIRSKIAMANPVTSEGPQPLMRKIGRADPFPVEALMTLAPTVRAIQSLTQAPVAIAAQSVLSAVALCVQGHANIQLPTGQGKPVSCFFVTCAKSGERKSSADDWALGGIGTYEKHLETEYAEDYTRFLDKVDIWEQTRKTILTDKKTCTTDKETDVAALGPRPQEPLKPTLCFPEPTFEGMVKYLASGRPSLGVFSQEGGSFIGGHAMSDEKKLMTAAGLSQFWDGAPVKRLRAGDGASVFRGRRLSFHLMAQPDVTAQLLSDRVLLDQGLISRFLVSAPDSVAGSRQWKEPLPHDRETVVAFQARTIELLRVECRCKDGVPNELEPREITLTPEARAFWIEFYNHIEAQAGDEEAAGGIVSLLNKLPEHAARLASILALFDDINTNTLESRYMAAGIELVQHYARESQRLQTVAQVNAELLTAQHVLDWLHDKWKETFISLPDIYQNVRRVKDKASAKKIVNVLVDHGWLAKCKEPVVVKDRSRKEAYEIMGRLTNV